MDIELYNLYKRYSKKQLLEIVKQSSDYTPDAIKIIWRIIKEKGIEKFINTELQKEKIEEKIEYNYQEYYYKNILELKNKGNYITININNVAKFESILNKNNIKYLKEESVIICFQSVMVYYFFDEDYPKAVEISTKNGI